MSMDKLSAAELSEAESDTSSIMGDSSNTENSMKPPSPASREQLSKRIESLLQENRVLKVEVETYKLRTKNLQEENRDLKRASVAIQAKAEQEEEFISNTLLKKIQELKKEKETLALNYEQEEECLTNDLSRKLFQLRQEKAELAATLQHEQESLVTKLMRKIKKLEGETHAKQTNLEQLRREKVELENTLEQEQEALVNRLWKRMDKLEAEKRNLQEKLDQPISAPPSPMDVSNGEGTDSAALLRHIGYLRNEVTKLKQQLRTAQTEHSQRTQQLSREEQQIREENIRLQRKLQMEMERREQLCRHLSESESSLEMEDERHFNEITSQGTAGPACGGSAAAISNPTNNPAIRGRTISSPVSLPANATIGRSVSPAFGGLNVNVNFAAGMAYNPPSPLSATRCSTCGAILSAMNNSQSQQSIFCATSPSALASGGSGQGPLVRTRSSGGGGINNSDKGGVGDKFVRPINPPASVAGTQQTSATGFIVQQSAKQNVAVNSAGNSVQQQTSSDASLIRQMASPSPVAMLQDENSNGPDPMNC